MLNLEPKLLTTLIVLAVLWTAEGLLPFYEQFRSGFRSRLAHDARNLALGVFNAVVAGLLFATAFSAIDAWADGHQFGLIRRIPWPVWAAVPAALILFDLWMYAWHRANHVVPFLWRFHRMHHTDPEMDATSAVRFHTAEVIMSRTAQLAVVPLLGISAWQLAAYEAILLPVILVHHSNVRLPAWLEGILIWLTVPPAMHRVHHSRLLPETNSNYGTILPYWDRLFRSFRLRPDARSIDLGLEGFDSPQWQTLIGLLRTPLANTKRAP